MKKIITAIFIVIAIQGIGHTQDINGEADWRDRSLYGLDTARQDTSRVLLATELAGYYKYYLPDSALFYGYKALELARKIKFVRGEVGAMYYILFAYMVLGNDSKALQICLQALKLAEKNNLLNNKASLLAQLGGIYSAANRPVEAIGFIKKSKVLSDSLHDLPVSAIARNRLVETYLILNQPDSALYYNLTFQSAREYAQQMLGGTWVIYQALLNLGRIQEEMGNVDSAIAYFRQSLSMANTVDMIFNSYFAIAQIYKQMNKADSAIYYANRSLEIVKGRGFYSNIIKANILLSSVYEKSDLQKALQHKKTAGAYKDSLDKLVKSTSFESLIAYDERERQYEIDTANATYRSQLKQYVLIAGLIVFLFIAFMLYRNNRNKQKAKVKIEKAYEDLKSTQSQLIQREKMASLGELTAGIAHEIQNPLNFVNNFSEVNKELLIEMNDEIVKGNYNEAATIAKNVIDNQERINHHGKRADAIMKGMLQHSRTSSGQKEPTDINALADEYLRLAYHGLRAKDKPFNAIPIAIGIETDFDPSIKKINVVPQEIGRVVLNLINNAFYAVSERQKQNIPGYEPAVTVSTRKVEDKVLISVGDNGPGIPQKVLDKIFQPFFTTKPTGQGTGLGLSLAYDIVKAHGGELQVETREGEGTTFIVQLL